ncbi:putative quinol monooxygenase [Curtobacterium sp. MCBA15_008]|uniref:putative quinol monooxygenase n=1 Tax=Curtobacterium sp. MCBA15_008 TaxID=1898736 RepID=UPI001C3158EB|nr:antibiotic biosynthesis monooxygenase [Curtobacterium sp. MCBA15_008]
MASISPAQPGKVIRFTAKPGRGDELFALCADASARSSAVDRSIISRSEDDPDTMWAMEWFISDEALAAQDADPSWDAVHEEIGALVTDYESVNVRAVYSHL